MHVDHVRAQPLAGDLEAQQRARAVFEEGIDDRQTGQRIGMLGALPVESDPLFRLVEEEEDLVPLQLADAQQVAMRKGPRTRRITGGVRRCLRSCH